MYTHIPATPLIKHKALMYNCKFTQYTIFITNKPKIFPSKCLKLQCVPGK